MKRIYLAITLFGIIFSSSAQQDISGELTLNANLSSEWSTVNFNRPSETNNGFVQYYGGNDSGMVLGVSGVNPIRFFSGGLERMRVSKEGDLRLSSISSKWSTITFKRSGETNNGFVQYYGGNDSGMVLGVSGVNPIRFFSGGLERMRVSKEGNVGIGITTPKNKLSVHGTIWAKEVKVSLTDAADWVFKDDYELKSLEEVEDFVKTNKHLPDVPSAEEFRENDLNVAEMDNLLLQKLEEMTLYMIDMNKEIKAMKEQNSLLKEKVKILEEQ